MPKLADDWCDFFAEKTSEINLELLFHLIIIDVKETSHEKRKVRI